MGQHRTRLMPDRRSRTPDSGDLDSDPSLEAGFCENDEAPLLVSGDHEHTTIAATGRCARCGARVAVVYVTNRNRRGLAPLVWLEIIAPGPRLRRARFEAQQSYSAWCDGCGWSHATGAQIAREINTPGGSMRWSRNAC